MPAVMGLTDDSSDADLQQRIEQQSYALFAGNAGKGGASEIVRMIGRHADFIAKRKLEMARARAKAVARR